MSEYLKRRKKLISEMPKDSLAIIFGSSTLVRNGDVEFPFRQNSDFLYLTGFEEPNAVAILESNKSGEFTIFCQDKDPSKEQWEGNRMGPENCKKIGAKKGFSIKVFNEEISKFLINKERIYLPKNSNSIYENMVNENLVALKKTTSRTNHFIPEEIHSVESLLHEKRLIKSETEIEIIKQACKISSAAHIRAMKSVSPKMYEYELEAEYVHEFMKNGARSCAYPSIVGGGKNACVLHYNENKDLLLDGDLVLVDAGCEFKGYASDITRTFPVNGKFSKPQEAIYEIVLEANRECIKTVIKDLTPFDTERKAVEVITQGLIDLNILNGEVNELIETKAYQKFYMHKVGHWMGMDVHDVGSYGLNGDWRKYSPGMITTIEPGIYFKEDLKNVPKEFINIGIRIEDDVLVTEKNPEVLTSSVPKNIKDIEKIMES